jgi:hypothetical protein
LPNSDQQLWQSLAHAISGQETSLSGFDDELIIRQAEFHGIGPLLHKNIQVGTVSGVSEQAAGQIRAMSYAGVATDIILNDATRDTLDLLATHDIPALLLKGTPVAHLYYEYSHFRPRADTDLYIHENDVKKAVYVLSNNGYQVNDYKTRKYSSKQFVAACPAPQTGFTHFDVHWKLTNRVMFANALKFNDCLETSQPVTELGANARCPSVVDLLIHACIHRIAHLRNTASHRLIWIYDIHLLVKSMDDSGLEQFQAKAKQEGAGVLCAAALEVSEQLFGTSLPGQYLDQLRENARKERSAKLLNSSKLRWAWADLRSLGSIREKAAFAWELLSG